jgi:hypothetical protein
MMLELARQDGVSRWRATVQAALAVLSGNVVWFGFSGMEPLLLISCTLLALVFWFDARGDRKHRSAIYAAAFLGLGILTRPEGIVAPAIFVALAPAARRRWIDVAICIGGSGIAAALLIALDLWSSGGILPATFEGRKWLYFGSHPPGTGWLALHFLIDWPTHLAGSFLPQLQYDRTVQGIGTVTMVLALVGVYSLFARGYFRLAALCGVAALQLALYACLMPTAGHGGRYQALAIMLILPLVAFGAWWVADGLVRRVSRADRLVLLTEAAVTIVLVSVASISLDKWAAATALGIDHINATQVRMARWVVDVLRPETKIAAFDIGAISYLHHDPVIDLSGLTDRSYLPYLRDDRVADYLRERHVEYVMLPEFLPKMNRSGAAALLHLTGNRSLRLDEVVSFSSPLQAWAISSLLLLPRQVLYEITYADLP